MRGTVQATKAKSPLLEMCRTGRLFDIQKWIEKGYSVNQPEPFDRHISETPLTRAVSEGFHSLVEVLLEAGVAQDPADFDEPVSRAIDEQRLDLIELCVQHGFDPSLFDMEMILDGENADIIEYFIRHGADLHDGTPFADALCAENMAAMKVIRRSRKRIRQLHEQVNTALRYHCRQGNMEWANRLLSVGADPFAQELPPSPATPDPRDVGDSAAAQAGLHRNYDFFNLPRMQKLLPGPRPMEYIRHLDRAEGLDILAQILQMGIELNDQDNGGCSLFDHCVSMWRLFITLEDAPRGRTVDNGGTRDQLKMIHLLARHGARWHPSQKEIAEARRALMRLIPDYTVELVWIMQGYQACSRQTLDELLRTPSMKSHVREYKDRLREILR
jgi:ankyrin repeat protein